MSQGHRSSRLLLKNQIVPIGFDTFHLSLNDDESGLLYGNLITGNGVFTFRRYDGKFGGGVAIEDGTTNLITGVNQTFGANWVAQTTTSFSSAYVPDWNSPNNTRMIGTSSTGNIFRAIYTHPSPVTVSGNSYTFSMKAKNMGLNPVYFYISGNGLSGSTATIGSGESGIFSSSGIATVTNSLTNVYIGTTNVGDTMDLLVYEPQIEQKSFRTSFNTGTRATGYLEYPKEVLTPQSFTVNAWVKLNVYPHPSATDQPIFELSNANTVNNRLVFLIKSSNILRVIVGGGASEINIDTAFAPTINTWSMLSVKFTGTNYHIYINGVLVTTFGSTLIATPLSSATMNIGGRYIGLLNGLIDDFIAVPYAMTDEEITAIYVSGIPVYNPYDRRAYAY